MSVQTEDGKRGPDAGVSLVEIIITMALMLIVGAVCLTAFINTNKVYRHTNSEATGLTDVRTVVERLGRDVRDARGVEDGAAPTNYPAASGSQLTLWIDYNSNYRKESSEIVTWKLQAQGTTGQFDVVRTQNGATQTIARTLVDQIAFSYDLPAPATRSVTADLTYQAVVNGTAGGQRKTEFSNRLRNVA